MSAWSRLAKNTGRASIFWEAGAVFTQSSTSLSSGKQFPREATVATRYKDIRKGTPGGSISYPNGDWETSYVFGP